MNVQVQTQRRGVPSGLDGPRRVLVVDDDRDFAAGLAEYLDLNGYEAETANDAALALDRAEVVRPGVALVDITLGRDSGLDLVARIKERHPETICVMITAHATVDTAIEAVKQGAYDYLRKPLVEGDVLLALERGFEKLDLEREKDAAEAALKDSEARFRDFTEAASDWVWEMDEDLRFTFVSERIRELTGVAPEDILGKTR